MDRHHLRSGSQETWRTFDPDDADDPWREGFRALSGLDEERCSAGTNRLPDLREDAEILTYVRTGTLTYQDESSRPSRMVAGEFLRTRACRVFQGSPGEGTQVIQSRIARQGKKFEPGDARRRFALAERRGVLRLVASPQGQSGSLRLHQDVRMYSSILDPGTHLIHELRPGRSAWLHVVQGRILLVDQMLDTGDGAALEREAGVSFTAREPSEILLYDLA